MQWAQVRADAVAIALAQGQLGLRLHDGQRRFQLVRSVGEEALARQQHAVHARHVLVDGLDQRLDLGGQGLLFQWRQVIGVARGHRGAEPVQRAQATPHAQPDDAQRQRHQHHFLLQRTHQDLAGQHLARLDGFPDQHPDQPRLPGGRVAHRQGLGGHAYRLPAEVRVVENGLVERLFLHGRHR